MVVECVGFSVVVCVGFSVVVVCIGFSVVVCVGFSVVVVVVVGLTVVVGFSLVVVVSGVLMVVVFSVEVVVVGVSMVVVFSVMNNNNIKLYLYGTFHDWKCSAKCFREQKLEAVLFRERVSSRSGRLSWPPGGAIIGQCEKGGKEVLNWHLGSVCAQFGSKRANGAGD